DIHDAIDLARRFGVLDSPTLLEVKNTLVAARNLSRVFSKTGGEYPALQAIAAPLPPPAGLVDSISKALSDKGEILDNASPKLAAIRSEMGVAHERLLSRLQKLVSDPRTAPMLQEALITQRNGRYVIPLRAEFKTKLRSIVHDQSASGATFFVEPLAVVEMNNRYRELQLEEQEEERRILADLSAQVGAQAETLLAMLEALAQFDLALMCARFADDLHAVEPVLVAVTPNRDDHPGTTIRLYQARHPLLDPAHVVPVDVDLDAQTFSLVITGPNTGGKTVTLKTVGLLVLMAQSGLHIPAQSGSSLSIFQDVFADIGDEQSIEQSLSTFSAHITNIARILKAASRETLVVLDELGAGTDPQEGAALARALLDFLVQRRIPSLVATHYPELKSYAHTTPGVTNASMEFDLKTLRPTYHLMIGLPGRSNALLIAERLGLPAEILQAARSEIHPDDLRVDSLLDEIHRQRDFARQARAEAEKARKDAERMRSELALELERIEDQRLHTLEQAQEQAEGELADLKAELEEVRRALNKARQPLEEVKSLQREVDNLEDIVQKPIRRKATPSARDDALHVGEKVRLRSLNLLGVVTAISEDTVEVRAGPLRARARLADIQRLQPAAEETALPGARVNRNEAPGMEIHPAPGMEVDVRGQRAEEALEIVQSHIEAAYLAGQPFVRIIHGKGTGRLRQVVREALRQSPHVRTVETGQESEGGDGVTVALIKTD
ncbi:MAG: endonuclease MutS2, partial [Anaerolineaceae bacterium]|nr:endonuclease MutS2 [Anaerolineaceae bacterium]